MGGELTFLSEAEAGGKTGPPGALRGRAEAAQKLRLQGEILAPPPTATGRGGQIPTPAHVQPQHPAQRGPGADGWQGARPPAGPFGEPGWGGGPFGSLWAPACSPLYLRCCRMGMMVSRGMLWARKSCQAQYCSKVSQSRLWTSRDGEETCSLSRTRTHREPTDRRHRSADGSDPKPQIRPLPARLTPEATTQLCRWRAEVSLPFTEQETGPGSRGPCPPPRTHGRARRPAPYGLPAYSEC